MSDQESVGDVDENDLEVIVEGDQEQQIEEINEEVNGDESQEQAEDDETKRVVKPKRVIKNPQPKLNEQTLKGNRGIAAIEGYFQRVKFKGRGYEEQDLNVLLKTYEYWCHRLFPKFPFDSCIARIENLGTKKATMTHIKRIRMGLNFDEPENPALSDEEVNDTTGFVETYNDEFDQLTSTREPEPEITEEQLERMRQNMEKAKRLREEKLQKIQQNAQNIIEAHNNVGTQDTETFTFDSISNGSKESNQNQDVYEEMETEDNSCSNNQEGNEEDIENILEFINEEENDTTLVPNKSDLELNNKTTVISQKKETDDQTTISTSMEVNYVRTGIENIHSDEVLASTSKHSPQQNTDN